MSLFQDDRPGEDWVHSFMGRWGLSSKMPSTLEKTRLLAARDPNIIYGYFDTVESEMSKLQIMDRPECLWNIDETNLYIDPQRTRVIAPKGVKAARTTATSGREAISVMAGISANGEKLPPLIIFKGKNIMASWQVDGYPGTQVARSENGWMTSTIFYDWFCAFCKDITQRPLLLLFDGHSTHINYFVVKKAREEGVSLLKLPPHTSDRLQPLDVCCFRPLKVAWDKEVTKWALDSFARRLNKPEFIKLTGAVWNDVFTVENIASAFKKTGLHPLDRTIYPRERFDENLVRLYELAEQEKNRMIPAAPATPVKAPPRPDASEVMHAAEARPSSSSDFSHAAEARPSSSSDFCNDFTPLSPELVSPTPPAQPPHVSPNTPVPPATVDLTAHCAASAVAGTPCSSTPSSSKKKKKPIQLSPAAMRFEAMLTANLPLPSQQLQDTHEQPSAAKNPPKKTQRRINPKCQVLTSKQIEEELRLDALRKAAKGGAKNKTVELREHVEYMEGHHKSAAVHGTETSGKKGSKRKAEEVVSEEEANTSSDESDNVATVEDSSTEEEEDTEGFDSDQDSDDSVVHFNERQYKNIQAHLEVNGHYLITFGNDLYYIGKILEINKKKIYVKCMDRLTQDVFSWKSSKKAPEEVNPDQFVSGPIRLHGTMPYTIKGVDAAHRAYMKYKKNKLSP